MLFFISIFGSSIDLKIMDFFSCVYFILELDLIFFVFKFFWLWVLSFEIYVCILQCQFDSTMQI